DKTARGRAQEVGAVAVAVKERNDWAVGYHPPAVFVSNALRHLAKLPREYAGLPGGHGGCSLHGPTGVAPAEMTTVHLQSMRSAPGLVLFMLAAACWLAAGPGGETTRALLACSHEAMHHTGRGHHSTPTGGPCFCDPIGAGARLAVSTAVRARTVWPRRL